MHAFLIVNVLIVSTVTIEDIQDVRSGHGTEGMAKYAKDVPECRCFSIVFKHHRKNLDLIASSVDDAEHWVAGLRKIITKSNSMSQRQKLQQYPFDSLQQRNWLGCNCRVAWNPSLFSRFLMPPNASPKFCLKEIHTWLT